MNIKRGLTRIYIIASFLWACFWISIGWTDNSFLASILIGILLPVILYFLVIWIIDGFKN